VIADRHIEVDPPVRMLTERDRQGTGKATPALALIEITFTHAALLVNQLTEPQRRRQVEVVAVHGLGSPVPVSGRLRAAAG
jgi:hypothetical protein